MLGVAVFAVYFHAEVLWQLITKLLFQVLFEALIGNLEAIHVLPICAPIQIVRQSGFDTRAVLKSYRYGFNRVFQTRHKSVEPKHAYRVLVDVRFAKFFFDTLLSHQGKSIFQSQNPWLIISETNPSVVFP